MDACGLTTGNERPIVRRITGGDGTRHDDECKPNQQRRWDLNKRPGGQESLIENELSSSLDLLLKVVGPRRVRH
jgi:hypothetical protein